MTVIEQMPDPKPTELVPDPSIWIVLWWSSEWPSIHPMHCTFYSKAAAIE